MYFYIPNISEEWQLLTGLLIIFFILFEILRIRGFNRLYPAGQICCYISVILIYTVFARSERVNCGVVLEPFWSYKRLLSGGFSWMFWQILENILVMIPLGYLLAKVLYFSGRKGFSMVLISGLCGMLLSIGIEVLQLVLHRGITEFDDIFNNTFGAVTGAALYYLWKVICRMENRRK